MAGSGSDTSSSNEPEVLRRDVGPPAPHHDSSMHPFDVPQLDAKSVHGKSSPAGEVAMEVDICTPPQLSMDVEKANLLAVGSTMWFGLWDKDSTFPSVCPCIPRAVAFPVLSIWVGPEDSLICSKDLPCCPVYRPTAARVIHDCQSHLCSLLGRSARSEFWKENSKIDKSCPVCC